MKAIISTKTHAVLDYLAGALITFSPWIFGFAHLGGAPLFIPLLIGSMQLVMALFSQHQLGLFKAVPMQLHLTIDMLAGCVLIASPFIYGFAQLVVWPHVLLGIFSLSAGLLTQNSPLYRVRFFDERGY
ncbi:hypothetical protein FPZ43_00145 [Mucilaginibacter pallidiroseus]|uniref:SPW repeat-containing integral membrane domain-containing protein n=1 Tax=Mucilaginibacter pallidiroseus TaxID=2599295 RepID=A0A563UI49_9SPHI|nr:hypothetical protein [Mucilaginibacter pallidiroseus]TWR30928.1 hypothetical protein FPZ43_00145 [Mucilaginibacter pallidiroseus]